MLSAALLTVGNLLQSRGVAARTDAGSGAIGVSQGLGLFRETQWLAGSALFGLAHLAGRESSLPLALWAFVRGLMFSALYLASGTLLAPILAHWLINYENMQYICNYDPTPLDIDRISVRSGYSSDR